MTKRIIYQTNDGGVAVVIPAWDARRQVLVADAVVQTVTIPATDDAPEHDEQVIVTPAIYRDETDEEFLTWLASKDVPQGAPFKIVETSDIPTDRTFRAAWEYQA